jgi:hypothetical protein
MTAFAALISLVTISLTAMAQEPKDTMSYSLQWKDAQVKISALASQCEKKPQTMISISGDSDERVLQVRCNIALPIERIQAISKFPSKIVLNGATLILNYSANVGAFSHTLHVSLVQMNGYQSNQNSRKEKGIVIVVPKGLGVDDRMRIEEDATTAIANEIKHVLNQSEEMITGKVMTNPLSVVDNGTQKLMLPVTQSIFLETIRKNPKQFGLDWPENIDLD